MYNFKNIKTYECVLVHTTKLSNEGLLLWTIDPAKDKEEVMPLAISLYFYTQKYVFFSYCLF